MSFAATVSAPVSTHIGDTALTEVEYGRCFDCEAELNIATMRIKEGTLRIVDFRVSNEDMASNRERLTKEAEQQVQEIAFSRQHVANYMNGLPLGEYAIPFYPPNDNEEPDFGDSMNYLQAVRLGLVENPEPWMQALVDDLHDLNKQWLAVKNYLLSSGSSLDEDYQQDQEQRIPIVELLMEKLSLTDTDLERVGLSRQLLLGEGKPLSRFLLGNKLVNERGGILYEENKPHGYYQFILPDHWSFVFKNPDPRDINRTLFKVEIPMSLLGKQCGGLQ